MWKYVTVVLCVGLVAGGCERKSTGPSSRTGATAGAPSDGRNARVNTTIPLEPQVIDRALLGSELAPDGTVLKENASVTAGKPIYLTMVLRELFNELETT